MLDEAEFRQILVSVSDFFAGDGEVIVTHAPGRLDVMGGIADYSGALVLELPLGVATFVGAQRTADRSIDALSSKQRDRFTMSLAELENLDYTAARVLLAANPETRWAAYVAGALVMLHQVRGMQLDRGVRLLIHSSVPSGKGVASSAALEVAAMRAIAKIYDLDISDHEIAILCQMVENLVVGAPCGVMDQLTSACGEENTLLALLCQPAQVLGNVAIPEGLEFWGIDSGIRHEIGGADYGGVRTGAFMGLRILESIAGDRWSGYLANVSPDEWRDQFREQVPLEMSGADFRARYGDIRDTVTHVDLTRTYAVRQPTEHPILEHARVQEFKRLLEGAAQSEAVRMRLGALMYEAHASYSACGLGSSGTDRLVEMVHAAGAASGMYGAKITGGGSGGVVAVLARAGQRDVVDDIARRYSAETGRKSAVVR